MATIEKLVVSLEARITAYEKALAKAQGTTKSQFARIESQSKKLERTLSTVGRNAFSGLTTGIVAALAPILSVSAALAGAKRALDEFSAVSDNAKASGLDPETFQELAYFAEQSGLKFDEFSGALQTFAKNAGLATVGKGKMIGALKALNPELLKNILATSSQIERIRLAADAISKEADASKKAALATVLFGDAGFKLVDAFNGGAAAIDAMANKARDLGLVIDRDLIARAEELGDELSTATQIMNLEFAQALVELQPILVGVARLAGGVADAIDGIAQSMKSIGDKSSEGLREELARLDTALAKAKTSSIAAFIYSGSDGDGIKRLQAERDKVAKEIFRRADQQSLAAPAPLPPTVIDPEEVSGRIKSAESILEQQKAVERLIENLKFEASLVGRTATEQEVLNAIRQAGAVATDEQKRQIESLITTTNAEREAIKANTEAMEEFGKSAKEALSTFVNDILDGKSAAESFSGILKSLASQLINVGIGSLGKTLNIPGFANGTRFAPGGTALVGERGPELVNLPRGSQVLPAAQTARAMSMPSLASAGSSGAISIAMPITIDATGADAAGLARVEQRLAQLKGELPGLTVKAVRDAKKRGVKL